MSTKTEITSDATKADKKDGQPVYNYQKTDNTPYLYTVTLYQAASNSIAAGTTVTANGSNAVAVGYNSKADREGGRHRLGSQARHGLHEERRGLEVRGRGPFHWQWRCQPSDYQCGCRQ
ncbi:hypothetical protein [Acidaminococcus timonensis]|uniref:hypothetical protein n=1 Tax=Acidaminococcus timonensis TaxID=1871002 RepID=UPI0030804A9B